MSISSDYCTLFDREYLTRGLVLHESLLRHCPEAQLRVFCMDEETEAILSELNLPGLRTISLSDLERYDPALLAVKGGRTQTEYCWTATPAICLYALETEPDLAAVTYLDADLMFFSSPEPLFDELGDDSVLITPHRYAPRWAHLEPTSGVYNVQFLTFRQSQDGLRVLRWWRDRCLEWCYARPEDGKLGDQKYLDDWPERFEGIHVLQHPGGGLAPWNVENYSLSLEDGQVEVDGRPLVFYHYQALRLLRGVAGLRRVGLGRGYRRTTGAISLAWTNEYAMREDERALIWEPYVRALGAALALVRTRRPRFNGGFRLAGPLQTARVVRSRARYLLGRLRRVVRARARSFRPVDPNRYRDTWRSPDVAAQMRELTLTELADPDGVAPFRTFVEAIRALVEDPSLPEPVRLLDFGCGVGHYSELLERHFPGRFEYTGCDYSESMVETARAEWPDRQFVVNDLFDNQLNLGSYDVVVAGALVDVAGDYQAALDILLGAATPYVVLHRQHVVDGSSHADLVSGYPGQTTYRSVLNRGDLEQAAARHGRTITRSFNVQGEIKTFVLVRESGE